MRARKILGRLLTAFVLVSIGFALGKETTRRSRGPSPAPPEPAAGTQPAARPAEGAPPGPDKVIVYYMHATLRCFTCNRMESLAESLVKTDFAEALAQGRLEWRTADFQEQHALAGRYGVGTSTVVVVKVRGGREVGFKRLDEVWTKVNDANEFVRYVGGAIREMLGGGGA
jgi:hypothetical protein